MESASHCAVPPPQLCLPKKIVLNGQHDAQATFDVSHPTSDEVSSPQQGVDSPEIQGSRNSGSNLSDSFDKSPVLWESPIMGRFGSSKAPPSSVPGHPPFDGGFSLSQLLQQIYVSRDDLLQLLKYIPIECLMGHPDREYHLLSGGRHAHLVNYTSVMERMQLADQEVCSRTLLSRLCYDYLSLLTATVLIQVIVAKTHKLDAGHLPGREPAKRYMLALSHGIVAGPPYQMEGSWRGITRGYGVYEQQARIGLTLRMFAITPDNVAVKVPLPGVSNRIVDLQAIQAACDPQESTGIEDESSPERLFCYRELRRRCVVMSCLRRFAKSLQRFQKLRPALRNACEDNEVPFAETPTSLRSAFLNSLKEMQTDLAEGLSIWRSEGPRIHVEPCQVGRPAPSEDSQGLFTSSSVAPGTSIYFHPVA